VTLAGLLPGFRSPSNSTVPPPVKVPAPLTAPKKTVRLPVTSPVSGRYVLVWFTKLPPNGQPSQYQVDVYSVTVTGIAAPDARP